MPGDYTYFYERSHKVKVANAEAQKNITVPLTAEHNGVTYTVTAVQKWGFCYLQSAQVDLDYCSGFAAHKDNDDAYSSLYIVHNCINDHSNRYLESVDFGENSNVAEIGDYAFLSCDKLKNITLPWRLTYLGVGAFEYSQGLEYVTFQTCPLTDNKYFAKTRLNIIQAWTFIGCFSVKEIYLADGITKIEGLSYGAPFQYLSSLSYIRLPNTLEYIGPHFLCTCTGLGTVTIPASVKYIDGACFHGCESLREVLLLGKAADLQLSSGDARTFSENNTNCGNHVNNATFYVVDQYESEYKSHSVWGTLSTDGYNNKIEKFPSIYRDLKANKWASIIFPPRVSDPSRTENPTGRSIDPETAFGEGTIVAVLKSAVRDDKDLSLYHLTYEEQEGEIPTGETFMIRPAKDVNYTMYTGADQAQDGFTIDMNLEHERHVTVTKTQSGEPAIQAVIYQKGKYIEEKLKTDMFIFQADNAGTDGSGNPQYKYSFRKVASGNVYARPCGSWWEIVRSGVIAPAEMSSSVNSRLLDGIDDIKPGTENVRFVIDAIYDLNGRRIPLRQDELPAGLFIINGKKVLVK